MRAIRHRADEGMSYRGRPVHAPPGVHEDAFTHLLAHLPRGERVADLGAGSGAFTQRLLDAGAPVDAVDFDATGWSLEVPLVARDLNERDWDLPDGAYGCAVAVEVLEHVENPTQFLRSAARLVRPGGLIYLTTPNVASVDSRRAMLRSGEMAFFRRGTLPDGGHRTILPFWLLEDLLGSLGLEVVERRFLGRRPFVRRPGRAWWKRPLVALVDLALLAIGRRIPREAATAGSVGYAVRVPGKEPA